MTARRTLRERCYRLVLRLYPRDFAERFADEMWELARARSTPALLLDLARSLPAQWRSALTASATPTFDSPREPMDILLQDLRFALRGLLRRPSFTIVAALTLSLGIGGTTAIFSVLDAVLIRPLPYPHGDRLVAIWGVQGTQGGNGVVYADYLDWRAQNRTFSDMGVYRGQSVNLTGGDTPDRLYGMFASASFMRLIGAASMSQGRTFTEAETEIATRAPIAVLSYESWQTRFGGDQKIVGKTLVLNGQPHVVVGVTRPHVQTPFGSPDVFIPIPYYPNASGLDRGTRGVTALGLLKPGVSVATAEHDLAALAKHQEEMYPTTNKGFGVELQPLREQLVGSAREPIYIVFGAVIVVLLIACANVSNLQLARATSRHRELSVRAALGAGRARIAQQLLTESILLSLVGGGAGLLLAILGTRYLSTVLAGSLPLDTAIHVDRAALAFALGVSVLSGLVFGLAPAWKTSRADLHDTLRVRSSSGQAHSVTRNTLVVVQLSLTLALLSCAGLLTRSLAALRRVDVGFDTKNLMTMQFRLPAARYDTPDKIWTMFDRTIAEIRAVPGVKDAALVRAFPFTGNGETYPVAIDGRPQAPAGEAPIVEFNAITPRYFSTMGISRLSGRDFAESDDGRSVPVMIVNDEFAARTWPNQSPIGKRVQFGGDERWWTVVGVVHGTKHFTLNEQPLLQAYVPHAQRPQIFTTVAVRTASNPLLLAKSIREAIWRVDREQPVWGIATVDRLLSTAVSTPRLIVRLTAGFAIVALLLGAIGIYGVLSYTMSQRVQEMGIRVALGAESRQVVRLVVGEGLRIVGAAIVAGLACSLVASRLVRSQLFGVGPTDLLTFGAVTLLLAGVAIIACYLPARRASRVDPMVALRTE